jgi:hypothetical protein
MQRTRTTMVRITAAATASSHTTRRCSGMESSSFPACPHNPKLWGESAKYV